MCGIFKSTTDFMNIIRRYFPCTIRNISLPITSSSKSSMHCRLCFQLFQLMFIAKAFRAGIDSPSLKLRISCALSQKESKIQDLLTELFFLRGLRQLAEAIHQTETLFYVFYITYSLGRGNVLSLCSTNSHYLSLC